MSKVKLYAVDVSEDFIDFIAEKIKSGGEKFVVIFPNKRPIRYLERALSMELITMGSFFSMREFVEDVVLNYSSNGIRFLSEVEKFLFILKILRGIEDLEFFKDDLSALSWAIRLSSLLRDIDINYEKDKVKDIFYVEGYVLDEAKVLLENLKKIYEIYLNALEAENVTFGGDTYRRCYKIISEDEKFFSDNRDKTFYICGFSYLSKLEKKIFDEIGKKFNTEIFFQINLEEKEKLNFKNYEIYDEWLSGRFWNEKPQKIGGGEKHGRNIYFYESFSTHSQIVSLIDLLKKIISKNGGKEISNPRKIGIIVPDPSSLFPLLMTIQNVLPIKDDLPVNVTLGYKVSLTPMGIFLDVLFEILCEIEEKGRVSSKNFIKLLNSEGFSRLGIVDVEIVRDIINFIYDENIVFIDFEKYSGKKFGEEIKLIHDKLILPFIKEPLTFENVRKNFELLFKMVEKSVYEDELHDLNLDRYLFEVLLKGLEKVEDSKFLDGIEINFKFLSRLFHYFMEGSVIPFEGNPLRGIQIMGMLEARGLSFENLIVLDVNEGILPSAEKVDPLMPESIKKELELSSREDREKLIRYNFFRLVDSSKNVYLFYQKGETLDEKKERSRFIEQLIFELEYLNGKKEEDLIKRVEIPFNPRLNSTKSIEKDVDVWKGEIRKISSSGLNLYLTCPYAFYLKYVKKIGERKEIFESPLANRVGSLIHYILERCFYSYKDRWVRKKEIEEIRKMVIDELKEFFDSNRFKKIKMSDEIKNLSYHFRDLSTTKREMFKLISIYRLNHVFNYFKREGDFKICHLEKKINVNFHGFTLEGILDRVDLIVDKNGSEKMRIVDYKTGYKIGSFIKKKLSKLLESLSDEDLSKFVNNEDSDYKFFMDLRKFVGTIQLPFYIFLFGEGGLNPENLPIEAVYYMMGRSDEDFKKSFQFDGKFNLNEFEILLNYLLTHIRECKSIYPISGKHCDYCSYNRFCKFSN